MPLQVRNFRFTFDETIPRHWNGGSAARTAFFDSFSAFLPLGERFFVNSVKPYIVGLTSPELQQEARAFCGQEGIHQREHERYNRMLDARGYPVARLERWVARLLSLTRAILLPRMRLAVTCALEHFTAIGARQMLSDRSLLDDADARMRAFWYWHGAEESEHKAVPFDVYTAAGGHYLERVAVMLVTTFVFQSYALLHVLIFLASDRLLFSRRAWRELRELLGRTTVSGTFRKDYRAYYRRDFHPSQLDEPWLIEAAQRELVSAQKFATA